ncbi:MAG: LysE family transporter [Methanomicrobiales archaeon]|nr:LysE family transporter [Methanomicrobiales archaeon]
MPDILSLFALGFLIGLTGALAPGPTLVSTISLSFSKGWTTGPKVVFGHALIELVLFLLIVLGVSSLPEQYSRGIFLLGGVALIIFGALAIMESRRELSAQPDRSVISSPFLAGVITSITNPYFWIWWLTIASTLILSTLAWGIIPAFAFLIGHWTADLSWYTLVAACIHKGRLVLTGRWYHGVIFLCGIFLIGFGIYYISNGISNTPQ